jgi:hypothetical protein
MKKKWVSMLLALALGLSLLSGCGGTAEPTDSAAGEETETVEWDFAAARDALDSDTVMLTVNGVDVTWDGCCYWLVSLLAGVDPGSIPSWKGAVGNGSSYTYEEYFRMLAEEYAAQFAVMESMAAAAGSSLTAQDQEKLEKNWDLEVETYGDGSEESFLEYLDSLCLSREYYDTINRAVVLNQRRFADTYGALGENVSDADVEQFITDQGYSLCLRIHFGAADPEGTERTEEELEEKRLELEGYLAELQPLAGTEAVTESFRTLMEEHTEDTDAVGSTGYLISPTETDDTALIQAVEKLGTYEMAVADTADGVDLLLRLPLTPDTVVGTNADGDTLDMHYYMAAWLDDNTLTEALEAREVSYSEAWENLDFDVLFPLQ